METTITREEAVAILGAGGYDAYGRVRLYGYIGIEHEAAGQMVAIKSVTALDRYTLASIVAKSNDGTVPISHA